MDISHQKMSYSGDVLAAEESRAVALGGIMVRGWSSAAVTIVGVVRWASAWVCSKILAANRTGAAASAAGARLGYVREVRMAMEW